MNREPVSQGDPFVLLLGAEGCEHVASVKRAVEAYGLPAVILDTASYPSRVSISYDPSGEVLLHTHADSLRMSECLSVYWRSHRGVAPRLTGQNDVDEISIRDSRGLLESMLCHDGPRWFNGYRAWAMHKLKPLQLREIVKLDIPLPETLLTNNVHSARTFWANVDEGIHKPVAGGSEAALLTPSLMESSRLDRVFRFSPVTLQQCIPGTNIRTFVIGEHVFSVEIRARTIDFRLDPQHTLHIHDTPAQVRDWSISACQQLCMRWTAIDWRLTPNGEYYFLEANPSPMFVGLSRATEVDVAALLAEQLVA